MIREDSRSKESSEFVKSDEVDDPLKGLLMDKGTADVLRSLRNIQRKMTCVQEAMVQLVDAQRNSAKHAGCDCMDLYLATFKIADGSGQCKDKAGVKFDEIKLPSTLEWRAKHSFAKKYCLGRAARLHPFDATHETYNIVLNYMTQTSPGYYKVMASFETARISLNNALRALYKIAQGFQKIQEEAEHIELNTFTKSTERLSRQIISEIDKTGKLAWILQGLYFEI